MRRLGVYTAAALAMAAVSARVQAALVVATASNGTLASAFDANITAAAAANDLIKAGSPTLGSAVYSANSSLPSIFTNVGLHDGSAAANSNYAYHALTEGSGGNLPVTYTFNLAGSATGYDITTIQSVAGWGDSQLGDQDFTVFIKTVSNPNFVQIGGDFKNAPFNQDNSAPSAANSTITTITDSTGIIASGVTAIQFNLIHDNFNQETVNGSSRGTLYRDIAVIGTATPVPEPTSIGALVAGSLMLMTRRSKRNR